MKVRKPAKGWAFNSVVSAIAVIAASAALWTGGYAGQEPNMITANAVSFAEDDANFYGNYAPELQKTLERMPPIDPETGLHVSEVKPGLFYVTEGVYQSVFFSTGAGVVVFDAPPSFAHKLPEIIQRHAPGERITHLIYSHDHTDHIGGASVFADIAGLTIVASAGAAASLAEDRFEGVILPTDTFEDAHEIEIGGETIEMRTTSFHSEDEDTVIYLPAQKFIVAVDTITPGEVPFMNFGATSDVGRYLKFFDFILAYDFDTIMSGHVSILGTRDDVIENRAYAYDVRDTVRRGMAKFYPHFENSFAMMGYKNANLAYRSVIEAIRDECAAEIIDRWKDKLSVVDVWADSHCETVVVYDIMH